MFDNRCCRCAAAIHCRYSLRSPIYCSSGFQKSTRCRYRVRATTCRAGIPPPSPPVSSSSSPRMIWICQMSNKLRFDEDRSAGDMAVTGLAELAKFARFADGDGRRRFTEFQDLTNGPALAPRVTVVGGLDPALRGAATHERDLIVGVLAVQAGFVSPSQVLTSAAAGLVDTAPDSLLTRLERT